MTIEKPKPPVRKSVEEQLDEALADSFPASDPVSFVTSQAEDYWNDDAGEKGEKAPPRTPGSKNKA